MMKNKNYPRSNFAKDRLAIVLMKVCLCIFGAIYLTARHAENLYPLVLAPIGSLQEVMQ